MLWHCHNISSAGHFGFLKTLHLVNRQFWGPHMKRDIEEYVRSCVVCTTMKAQPGPPGLLQPVADHVHPWEQIAMNFIMELPESQRNTIIWMVIDLFSKQAHILVYVALPSASKLTKLFVIHIYRLHGTPKQIISDVCSSLHLVW